MREGEGEVEGSVREEEVKGSVREVGWGEALRGRWWHGEWVKGSVNKWWRVEGSVSKWWREVWVWVTGRDGEERKWGGSVRKVETWRVSESGGWAWVKECVDYVGVREGEGKWWEEGGNVERGWRWKMRAGDGKEGWAGKFRVVDNSIRNKRNNVRILPWNWSKMLSFTSSDISIGNTCPLADSVDKWPVVSSSSSPSSSPTSSSSSSSSSPSSSSSSSSSSS